MWVERSSSYVDALRFFLSVRAGHLQHRGHRGHTESAEKTNLRFEISILRFQISNFKFQISNFKSLCSLRLLCALCVKNLNARLHTSAAQTTLIFFTLALILSPHVLAQKKTAATKPSAGAVSVKTQPAAAVWLDDIRHGTTGADGTLELKKVSPGSHRLRVRATGFAERTLTLLPTQRGVVNVPLRRTTDEAELAFQQAEEQREKGGGDEGRKRAAELYRTALKLRPRFPAAHVGLARVLLAQEDYDAALEQIDEARRDRRIYPEASAIEGRILRAIPDEEGAVNAYRRAIREARGFQPEAHTGLGIILEERGDHEGAVASFRKAIAQLSDTEPALYEFLGRNLERLERWKEAVAAYEKYLELAPEGSHASAINSIIDQLRQQAAEQPISPIF